jgi:preprotein translocase subunit SecG
MGFIFATVLSLLAIFLILLVLVQRGRGGGLAGALGGMGGSSAFGAKAGDVFTRITIYAASVWIIVCLLALYWAKHRGDMLGSGTPAATTSGTESETTFPRSSPPPPADGSGESKSEPVKGPQFPTNPPAEAETDATPPTGETATPSLTPPASPRTETPPANPPAGPIGEERPPGK